MHDPSVLALTLSLRDRFADHGIVGFCLAFAQGNNALIDTLLLSCRVIGRTAERMLVAETAKWAAQRGCASLLGIYRPTDRNRLVEGLYLELGFTPHGKPLDDAVAFEFDLLSGFPQSSSFIQEMAS